MRPAPRRRSGPCLRKPRAIRLHLSARHDRALQMDAQASVIEMKRDEPAALKESAMFSRHRPLPVGWVGLTAFYLHSLVLFVSGPGLRFRRVIFFSWML